VLLFVAIVGLVPAAAYGIAAGAAWLRDGAPDDDPAAYAASDDDDPSPSMPQ
jgi:hypothetical protein